MAQRREVVALSVALNSIVDVVFSAPILVTWRKLRPYVEEERALVGRETFFEWFQWLAERMLEHESREPTVAAYVQHARWRQR